MKKITTVLVAVSLMLVSFGNFINVNADEVSLSDERYETDIASYKEEETKVNVTFEPNGGTMSNHDFQIDKGTSFFQLISEIDEPVKVGFIFMRWYTDPELTHAVIGDIYIEKDMVFYAHWEEAFDHTKLSNDLQDYLKEQHSFEFPVTKSEIEDVEEVHLAYLYTDDDNSSKIRTIRDFTGIEFLENVHVLNVFIDINEPVSEYTLSSLSKLKNIDAVNFNSVYSDEFVIKSLESQAWENAKIISDKQNRDYYKNQILKYLMSFNYILPDNEYDNKVNLSFDGSLGISDYQFMTDLNSIDSKFQYLIDPGEAPLTYLVKPEVEIIEGKTYYKMVFNNPFVFAYENIDGEFESDSVFKFTTISGRSSFNYDGDGDYSDDCEEILEEPLIFRYTGRNGKLEVGYGEIEVDDYYETFEVLINEMQFDYLVFKYGNHYNEYDYLIWNNNAKLLSGEVNFSIDSELHNENNGVPEENFETDLGYQVILDVSDFSSKHTVSFVENGGTEVADLTEVETGTKLTEPSTTRDGYTFKGWYRDETFTTPWNFDVDLVEENVILYAKWEAIPVTYTVTFEENGGTEVANLTGILADSLIIEPITHKDGFIFVGWYTDSTFITSWNFTVDTVNSDIILYAKWNEKNVDPKVDPEPEVKEPEDILDTDEKLPKTGMGTELVPVVLLSLGGLLAILETIRKKKIN